MQINGVFEKDWHKAPILHAIPYSLNLSELNSQHSKTHYQLLLSFTLQTTPHLHPNSEPGTFLEGLWNYDVFEFFLKTGSSSYLELHLAPNGAWWAMHFDSERVRSKRPALVKQKQQTHWQKNDEHGCNATFEISEDIYYNESLLGNICGIFGEKSNRKFLSRHKLTKTSEPNFHKQELFKEF